MNILTKENFSAERQPNGEVWITCRKRKGWRDGAGQVIPSALLDDVTIKIPKEECEELAKLLDPDLEKPVWKMMEAS